MGAVADIFSHVQGLWNSLPVINRNRWDVFANKGFFSLKRKIVTLEYTGRQAFSALSMCVHWLSYFFDNYDIGTIDLYSIDGSITIHTISMIECQFPPERLLKSKAIFFDNLLNYVIDISVPENKSSYIILQIDLLYDFDFGIFSGTLLRCGGHPVGFALYLSNEVKDELSVPKEKFIHKFCSTECIDTIDFNIESSTNSLYIRFNSLTDKFIPRDGWYYSSLIAFDNYGQQRVLFQKCLFYDSGGDMAFPVKFSQTLFTNLLAPGASQILEFTTGSRYCLIRNILLWSSLDNETTGYVWDKLDLYISEDANVTPRGDRYIAFIEDNIQLGRMKFNAIPDCREVNTDPDFSNPSLWLYSGNCEVTGGEGVFYANGSPSAIYQSREDDFIIEGHYCTVSYDVTYNDLVGGDNFNRLFLYGVSYTGINYYLDDSIGSHSYNLLMEGTNPNYNSIRLNSTATSGMLKIDNFSVHRSDVNSISVYGATETDNQIVRLDNAWNNTDPTQYEFIRNTNNGSPLNFLTNIINTYNLNSNARQCALINDSIGTPINSSDYWNSLGKFYVKIKNTNAYSCAFGCMINLSKF
jgi:hypothetical protein